MGFKLIVFLNNQLLNFIKHQNEKNLQVTKLVCLFLICILNSQQTQADKLSPEIKH